jgi:excisionase family DNA binding protein
MPAKLIGTSEAARILDVTDETIRRWVEAGRIRYIRLPSGQLRFERADVDAIRRPVEPEPTS